MKVPEKHQSQAPERLWVAAPNGLESSTEQVRLDEGLKVSHPAPSRKNCCAPISCSAMGVPRWMFNSIIRG
jgi:hypothetical protein